MRPSKHLARHYQLAARGSARTVYERADRISRSAYAAHWLAGIIGICGRPTWHPGRLMLHV